MKNFITLIMLCFACYAAQGQDKFTYKIKADSVKITNDSCNAELILENSTKNIKGFLYNRGNGRTEFRKISISNDTLFCGDTLNFGSLFWKLKGNSGINPSTNFIGTTDNNPLIFKTSNIERMRIREANGVSDGFLGIGTGSPASMLHLYGLNPTITIEGDNVNSYYPGIVIKSVLPSGNIDPYGITASYNGGLHIFSATATGRRVSISASYGGNVSLSTDSTLITHRIIGAIRQATDIFDVSNNIATLAGVVYPDPFFVVKNNGKIVFNKYKNNGSEDSVLSTDVNGVVKLRSWASAISSNAWSLSGNTGTSPSSNFLGTTDAQRLVFRTNNTERATIDVNGKLGIGTTTPTEKLHVEGNGLLDSLKFKYGGLITSRQSEYVGYWEPPYTSIKQADSTSRIIIGHQGAYMEINGTDVPYGAGNTGGLDISTNIKKNANASFRVFTNNNAFTRRLFVNQSYFDATVLDSFTVGVNSGVYRLRNLPSTTDSANKMVLFNPTTKELKYLSNWNVPLTNIDSTLKMQGNKLGVKVDTVLSYFTRDYRSNYAEIHEEFWNGVNEMGTDYSGTGATVGGTATTEVNHPGLVQLYTGTQSNGRASVMSYFSPVYAGSGQCYYETQVYIPTLSASTQRFQLVCGLFASFTGVTQASGVFFLYDEGGVSTGSTAASYWQTCTGNGGTRTYNTSLTQSTVPAAGWSKLRIYLDYVSSTASFYINGTLVSTHTANLPSGTALNFGAALFKSAGTTARFVNIDYISLQRHFATAR